MKLIFNVLISILLFSGCSKNTDLIKSKDKILGFENVETYIDNIKTVDWKIGDFRAHVLHKGFTIMIKLPHFTSSQLEEVVSKTSVDSWVLRYFKKSDQGTEQIGSIYVPFVHLDHAGNQKIKPQEAIYVNVYYAAAALSSRLENLKCPAMKHRKMIEEWSIKNSDGPKKIIISFSNVLSETPVPSEILAENLNGNMSLIGEYSVELALYNSKTKVLHSEFLQVGNTVKITKEKEVEIKECDNFQVPSPDYDHKDKLKEFRFK